VKYDYDLFTIGGGSGGVRASRVSATMGARVAIAENDRFGGTCVNVGCIPKKLFSYAAHFREDFEVAKSFGWTTGEPRFDWPTLLANKNREIARLNGVYEKVLRDAGVTIHLGRATVRDAHTVELGGKTYTAQHILIATGAWPQVPAIVGREHAITSNEAFFLERLPRRALLVGGGYIAVEFASIFNGLGVETTLAYRGAHLLRGFDADLGTHLAEEVAKKGVMVRLQTNPIHVHADRTVDFANGTSGSYDLVMFATGRKPNTASLGLERAGVALAEDGAVLVDAYSKSSVDSIWAIGDVTNRVNLTPVATAEGMWLARTLFGNAPSPRRPREHPDRGVLRPERLDGRSLGRTRARAFRGSRRLHGELPRAQEHARRPAGQDVHEARRRRGNPAGGRRAHDRAGRRRDHPGDRDRGEARRDQSAVRRDDRHPPHGCRGVRHDADQSGVGFAP
jgi:glutathione reductase (NADPH)